MSAFRMFVTGALGAGDRNSKETITDHFKVGSKGAGALVYSVH